MQVLGIHDDRATVALDREDVIDLLQWFDGRADEFDGDTREQYRSFIRQLADIDTRLMDDETRADFQRVMHS